MKNIKHLLSNHAARLAVLLAVLAPLKGQSLNTDNLVVNGGFETGDFSNWTFGDPDNTYVNVDDGSGGIPPHSGTFLADLNGSGSGLGYLSQTLATTPGANYVISFWVNNYWQDGNEFLVSWNGNTIFGPTSISSTVWTNIQLQVTATGASTVLQFGFEDFDDALGFDDVSVELLPPSPIGLQAVAGNNQVTLTWTAAAGLKVISYEVLRSMNSGGPWMQIGPVMVPTNYTYTDGGLVNGTTYYYEVAGLSGGAPIYSFVVSATPVPPPPYTYTTNNGTITITGYAGPGGAVTITNTINDLPVTSIGNNAFAGLTSMTSVTIPNSVTNLGSFAFSNCTSLVSVTLGTNLISIGTNAFQSCTKLAGIVIPNSVTSLGSSTFSNCTSLANVTIGTNVTSIGNSAFQNCASLTSVTIPGSVTNLGGSAFASCAGLTNATIGTNVANLGSCAFSNCTSLAAVYFQGNAPSADSTVFTNDPATVYYLPGTTGWNAPTFDGRPAVLLNPSYLCTTANGAITIIGYTGSGGAVTITNTINGLLVTTIGTNAFNGCASLTSVTIPASVTNIADSAFQNCGSLAGVYFLGNPPSLGGSSVFLNDNNAIGYNAAGTTGWGLTFDGLTMVLVNNTTINGTNHYAYGANLGWLDWRSDTNHGAVIKTNVCSGYIYSANFGWISLGNGSPVNGLYYQNNSASDFGVNVDGSGNLRGYAYGANIGWITFTNFGAPQVDLASGSLSGSVWSANWGWISLSNVEAYVQTSAIQQSSPAVTAPILGGITFAGGCFGFSFTNVPGASFTVWTSTDLTQPFSNWTKVGTVTEVPGVSYSQYQFTDPQADNNVQQFYRVSSP